MRSLIIHLLKGLTLEEAQELVKAARQDEDQKIFEKIEQLLKQPREVITEEPQPIKTGRPSWPRMKRYFEEDDVRRDLIEKGRISNDGSFR